MAWWDPRLKGGTQAQADLPRVLDLLAVTLEQTRFPAAAAALVTETAVQLGCDRVALGTRLGPRTRLGAISHSADFNRKGALPRDIAAAMDEAIDQQETVTVPAPEGALPLVSRAHQALLDRYGTKFACSVPLSDGGRIVGALTLERTLGEPFSSRELALLVHTATLVGPVLEARRRDDRWLGAKAWDSLKGHAGTLFGPRHLALKAGTLAAAGAALFLATATGDYRVSADATLEGSVQRAIVAPIDGFVAEAAARAGDRVEAGRTLAALEDKDLRLEQAQWNGEREKLQREYSDALARGDRAQVRILGAQVEQAETRLALIAEQLARTRIAAPFAGILVSGDLSQSLGAPVSRGDVLFQLAPLDSYRVILQVDERDISALALGQRGRLALAGLPGEPLTLSLRKITPVAVAEQGRNLFRVEAELDGLAEHLRPGMRGVAKIEVDRRSLLWISTHRLVQWIGLWWWSWAG
jgi:RND family efflux transporter MFP subunit